MKISILIIFVLFLLIQTTFSQVENVQITHGVYTFLKEMKVKGILDFIREDDPVLSRFEIKKLLDNVESNRSSLSETENKILNKYLIEFSDNIKDTVATQLFNPENGFFTDLDQMITNKVKYLYAYQEPENNIYVEWLGHFYHGQDFSQNKAVNSDLYDIGFRIRGTVFDHLGYNLTVIKGGSSGNRDFAKIIEPRLASNYKWIDNVENIDNYDFTYGYLKYLTQPYKDMKISVQLGREDITLGYGYGSKLLLSGDNPTMDFLKFNFDYGMISFSSLHATTTGYFSNDRSEDYSKFFAFNHLKLKFNKLLDVGIGEAMIYSGRGIEIAYLTPVGFYKFIEMETQDRDNGNLYLDLQTKFIKNIELQATFFLDENILSNLADLEKYTNKTAYQLGAFWYQPMGINDLSLIVEYTKIRPYVYTHFNIKNNYTGFGTNLGHRIGPNSDELMFRGNYNLNEWIRFTAEYRYQREGNNVYADDGTLIKNVGGDVALTHGFVPENTHAYFLDGERVNTQYFILGTRIEPIRDYIFDVSFNYTKTNNTAKNVAQDFSYALLRFTLEY